VSKKFILTSALFNKKELTINDLAFSFYTTF